MQVQASSAAVVPLHLQVYMPSACLACVLARRFEQCSGDALVAYVFIYAQAVEEEWITQLALFKKLKQGKAYAAREPPEMLDEVLAFSAERAFFLPLECSVT